MARCIVTLLAAIALDLPPGLHKLAPPVIIATSPLAEFRQ
jgi:hypothetical protein